MRDPKLVDGGVSSSAIAALAGSMNRRDLAANAAGSRNQLEQVDGSSSNPTVLGVFVCDCGGQIGAILDTEHLQRCACELPGVAFARRLNYSCSPDGVEAVLAASQEEGVDRVLVAGCTPRLMARRFQTACRQAGRDVDLVELVDIREGCASVHGNDPQQATAKALDLIRMGVARAARHQPYQPVSAQVASGALVIGGGVAGMTAALTLANAGQPVRLVEREAVLGGMLNQAPPRNGLVQRIEQVTHHPNIDVLLHSQVAAITGTVGRYTVSLTPSGALGSGNGRQFDVGAIVVATGAPLAQQPDASVLAHLLGIAQDEHGFFPEPRYRLRPEGYAERGIYVCGAAHYPADQKEVELQAISAAFKALRHLRAGQVSNRAPVASVDPALCTGCANCVEPCPFDAISMHQRAEAVDLAQIDPLLCTGCGNCVVVCPVKAISQPVDSDAQVLAQIEAALRTADGGSADRRVTSTNGTGSEPVRILVFGCEWSSHAAAELAGANRLSYPVETRLIRLRCSARFDPIHILWALFNGADGVFLGACAPGDCHYIDGNRYAQERIATLSRLLAANGFDPRRLRMEWITPDDPRDFVSKVSGFTELVARL
ncbi:MAG TPA: hydrogenase iron-sulfur subunit [Anaerolineae bacterium]|nr:hydrogenase iron-sulfur subunit [Anaerolineae bacterium]